MGAKSTLLAMSWNVICRLPPEGQTGLTSHHPVSGAEADAAIQCDRAALTEGALVEQAGGRHAERGGSVESAIAHPEGKALAALQVRRVEGKGDGDAFRQFAVTVAECVDLALERAAIGGEIAEGIGCHDFKRSGLGVLAALTGDAAHRVGAVAPTEGHLVLAGGDRTGTESRRVIGRGPGARSDRRGVAGCNGITGVSADPDIVVAYDIIACIGAAGLVSDSGNAVAYADAAGLVR